MLSVRLSEAAPLEPSLRCRVCRQRADVREYPVGLGIHQGRNEGEDQRPIQSAKLTPDMCQVCRRTRTRRKNSQPRNKNYQPNANTNAP